MGYVRQLYYGTAGSAAGTLLTAVKDISMDISIDYGDTTIRGNGVNLPIGTAKPVKRTPKLSWNMPNEPNDAQLALLRTAAKAGTGIALLVKELNGGATLLDGDFFVQVSEKAPLGGEQDFSFEATATRDFGRDPVIS